jgi:hypothetical protein
LIVQHKHLSRGLALPKLWPEQDNKEQRANLPHQEIWRECWDKALSNVLGPVSKSQEWLSKRLVRNWRLVKVMGT